MSDSEDQETKREQDRLNALKRSAERRDEILRKETERIDALRPLRVGATTLIVHCRLCDHAYVAESPPTGKPDPWMAGHLRLNHNVKTLDEMYWLLTYQEVESQQ